MCVRLVLALLHVTSQIVNKRQHACVFASNRVPVCVVCVLCVLLLITNKKLHVYVCVCVCECRMPMGGPGGVVHACVFVVCCVCCCSLYHKQETTYVCVCV